MGSKNNFVIDEVECLKMVTIFEFMKRKKWLKPYNAPKFRSAYNSVYPREYRGIIKRMGKKKRKSQMFLLYRKYYHFFIDDNQYQYWLRKRDAKEKIKMRGTVKFFDKKKGWGFITSDEGTDYFVHFSGISGSGFRSLESDDVVEFDLKETERGWKAVNVESIMNKADDSVIRDLAEQVTEATTTLVTAELVTDAIKKVMDEKKDDIIM